MIIAVAADSASTDAPISMHAARAPFYLLYDENGRFLNAIENPFSNTERGAAPRTTEFLLTHEVDILVAGEFGERFIELLQDNNISTVVTQGTASNAIKNVIS